MSWLSARLRSASVGVMLSVSTTGVESGAPAPATREIRDANAPVACEAGAPPLPQPLIRDVVEPPSPDFTTYVEGELVRVSIPSNWRELPGSNAVTFAPEGAYGNAGVKSVFTHGLAIGLARNDKRNLWQTTNDFIESYVVVNPLCRRPFAPRGVTIADRLGLHIVLSDASEVTGELERIEMFTTLLRDGTLFYVMTIVPRDCAGEYAETFRRIVGSINIMDDDRRGRE